MFIELGWYGVLFCEAKLRFLLLFLEKEDNHSRIALSPPKQDIEKINSAISMSPGFWYETWKDTEPEVI
jgi:hypothetical protein